MASEVQFKFGPGQSLYGCYHPTRVGAGQVHALLVCQPIAHEYERCHRACRQIAMLASAAGLPAMRFDYFGTGDSDGDTPDVTVDRWVEDVVAAAGELRQRAGAKRVSVVGVRHGASLVSRAAARVEGMAGLFAWGPVFDGSTVLDDWRALQDKHDASQGRFVLPDGKAEDTSTQVLGFAVSPAMDAALTGLTFASDWPGACSVVGLQCTAEDALARAYAQRHAGQGARVDTAFDAPATWSDASHEAVVPRQLLVAMVQWVKSL